MDIGQALSTLNSLKGQWSALQAFDDLLSFIQANTNRVSELQAQLGQIQSDISSNKQSRDAQKAIFDAELADLQSQIDAKQNEHDTLIATLTQQVEDAKAAAAQAVEEANTSMEEAKANATTEIAALQQQIADAQGELKIAQDALASIHASAKQIAGMNGVPG